MVEIIEIELTEEEKEKTIKELEAILTLIARRCLERGYAEILGKAQSWAVQEGILKNEDT